MANMNSALSAWQLAIMAVVPVAGTAGIAAEDEPAPLADDRMAA